MSWNKNYNFEVILSVSFSENALGVYYSVDNIGLECDVLFQDTATKEFSTFANRKRGTLSASQAVLYG